MNNTQASRFPWSICDSLMRFARGDADDSESWVVVARMTYTLFELDDEAVSPAGRFAYLIDPQGGPFSIIKSNPDFSM